MEEWVCGEGAELVVCLVVAVLAVAGEWWSENGTYESENVQVWNVEVVEDV